LADFSATFLTILAPVTKKKSTMETSDIQDFDKIFQGSCHEKILIGVPERTKEYYALDIDKL